MTVNTVRRPRRRTTTVESARVVPPVGSLAIGEIGQTVFDCPTCGRPLAIGVRRCPGCRTRLVLGVPLSKAAVFAAVGLAIGVAAGSVGAFVFATSRSAAAPNPAPVALTPGAPASAATAATPAAAASEAVSATASPITSSAPSSAMSPLVRSALSQAVSVDERLAASEVALRGALAASRFSASDAAEILRSISADVVYGEQLADRISRSPETGSVGADLATIYGSIHDAATDGLVASVRDAASYRATTTSMIVLLGRVADADARARSLLAQNGVSVPESAAP
jgi:trimeric autotransporter adhesin